MATTGGLLRLPRFFRQLIEVAKEAQVDRTQQYPMVFNREANINDLFATIAFAATLFCLRVLLHYRVFPWLFSRHPKKLHPKLSENLFYSVWYTAAFVYYVAIVRPSVDWDVSLITNKPDIIYKVINPIPPPMNTQEHIYYVLSCGFYSSATAFLLIFDGRRSDFHELCIHHVVTICLMAVSYFYGYVRGGILIIALHDVGDIFLYSAKLIHYLGYKGLDTAIFAVFAVMFYVPRLLLFPRILYAVGVETLQTVIKQPDFNEWAKYLDTYIWHHAFFVLFLGTLLVLHCFWFALILKMIYRELFEGIKVSDAGDIRSDDEGDENVKSFQDDDDGFFDDAKKEQ